MPKRPTDIELPNQTGRTDPRLDPSARVRQMNIDAFNRQAAARKPAAPASDSSSAVRRISKSVRSLLGGR